MSPCATMWTTMLLGLLGVGALFGVYHLVEYLKGKTINLKVALPILKPVAAFAVLSLIVWNISRLDTNKPCHAAIPTNEVSQIAQR